MTALCAVRAAAAAIPQQLRPSPAAWSAWPSTGALGGAPQPSQLPHTGRSGLPAGPSERREDLWTLSKGKIADTLSRDYPDLLERAPDFHIYEGEIELTPGQSFEAPRLVLQGKTAYVNACSAARMAARSLRDGEIQFRLHDGEAVGHALKVHWTLRGALVREPIYVSAISLYALAYQASVGLPCQEDGASLPYKVYRHKLEFVEVQPPSVRTMLLDMLFPSSSETRPCLS